MSELSVSLRIQAIVDGLSSIGVLIDEIKDLGGESRGAGEMAAVLGKELADLGNKQRIIDQFVNLKTAVKDTADQLEVSRARTAALGREIKATETPSKGLTREFENARKETQKLADQEQRQLLALQKLRGEMSAAGISSQKLALSQAQVRQAVGETEGRMNGLKQRLTETRNQTKEKFGDPTTEVRRGAADATTKVNTLGESFRNAGHKMAGWFLAAVGFNKLRQGFQSIIDTGARFETLEVRVNALMGSLEGGQRAIEWIKDFAKNTPLQVDGVTDAFARLKQFGLDPMDGTLQALVDQNAKMGGSQESLERIILGVGQAWTKQKLQGQEIMQLMEAGIPVWDLLSSAMGKNVMELQQLSEKGRLGRTEIKLLIDEIAKSSKGAAAAQMATWAGLVSNVQDVWTGFLDRIAKSGALDFFKRQLQGVLDTTEQMANDGSLQRYAESISSALVKTAEVIKATVSTLFALKDALVITAQAFAIVKIGGWAADGRRFSLALKGSVTAMAATGAAATATAAKVGVLSRVFAALPRFIPVTIALVAIEGVIKGAEWLGEVLAKFGPAGRAAEDALSRVRAEAQRNEKEFGDLASQYQRFADVQIKGSADLARMTKGERDAYLEALKGAEQYQTGVLGVARAQEELGQNTLEAQNAATAALHDLHVAVTAVEQASKSSASVIQSDLSPAVQKLVAEFRAAAAGGKSASDALSGLLKPIDINAGGSIAQITDALDELIAKGDLTEAELNTGLRDVIQKLSVDDLTKLRLAARATFDEMGQGGAAASAILKETVQSALKSFGVDLGTITTGISATEREAIKTFAVIGEGFDGLGLSAKQNAEVLKQALTKALEDVSSKAGLKELRDTLRGLGSDGELSGSQVSAALALVDGHALGLADNLKKVGDEGKSAGDKTADAMDKTADAISKTTNKFGLLAARLATMGQQEVRQLGDDLKVAFEKGLVSASDFERMMEEIQRRFNDLIAIGAGMSAALAKPINAVREEFAKFGDEAVSEFNRLVESAATANVTVEKFWERLAQGTDELRRKYQELDEQNERTSKNQNAAAERLIASLTETNSSTEEVIRRAKSAAQSMRALDSSTLDRLNRSIEEAERRLDAIRDKAKSAVDSLRDELSRLQGDETAIEQRDFANRLKELEALRAEARAAGDNDALRQAQEAIKLLNETHKIRMDNIRKEAEERARSEEESRKAQQSTNEQSSSQRASSSAASSGQPTSNQTAPRVGAIYRVQFETRRGTATGDFGSQSEVDILLEALARDKARAN